MSPRIEVFEARLVMFCSNQPIKFDHTNSGLYTMILTQMILSYIQYVPAMIKMIKSES